MSTRSSVLTLVLLGGALAGCASVDPAPAALVTAAPRHSPTDDLQVQAAEIQARGEATGAIDWNDVVVRMRELVANHPRFGLGWYNLGVAYQQAGDRTQATESYRRALAVDGAPVATHVNLASLAVAAGDRDQAVEQLESAVAKDASAVDARLTLATYRLAAGELEEAERLAKEVLARQPGRTEAYCVLARLSLVREAWGYLRLVVARGLKLTPESACLRFALGELLLAEGDPVAGLASLERAVELDPSMVDAQFRVAEIAVGYKNFDRAVSAYRAVVDRAPESGPALVNLGVAYRGQGKFEDAEAAYRRATQVEDAAAAAHFNLGLLYLRHFERLEAAADNLQRYLSLAAGDDPVARSLLQEVEQLKQFKAQEAAMAEEAAQTAEQAAEGAVDQPAVTDGTGAVDSDPREEEDFPDVGSADDPSDEGER